MSDPASAKPSYKYTGRYVVLFKCQATEADLNDLKSAGVSFPEGKKSYHNRFKELKVIIGEFNQYSRDKLEKSEIVEFVHEEYILPASKAVQGGGSDTEGDLQQPVAQQFGVQQLVAQQFGVQQFGVQHPVLQQHMPGVPFGIARLTRSRFDGDGVDIYVVDGGVRIDHSEFGGRAQWTTFEADNSPVFLDDDQPLDIIPDDQIGGIGHGTHVAGTAAGNTCGVAKAATIIAIKPFVRWDGEDNHAPTGIVIMAILWACLQAGVSGRPSIINYSMDGIQPEWQWMVLKGQATLNHVHFVYAAGNNNANLPARPVLPALPDDAIYVGASDWEDKRWRITGGGSNFGPGIDVFAPGAFIISASHVYVNQFKLMSGTSMAAPHVAGLIACLISAEPDHARNFNPNLMKARVLELAEQAAMDFTGDAGPIGTPPANVANPDTTRRLAHFP